MVDWGAVAQWAGFGVLVLGLGYTMKRNDIVARRALDTRLTETERKITKEINSMKVTCAGARGAITTRLDNHDRELKEAKKP